jgi:mono/diheme cytochrome c family protein
MRRNRLAGFALVVGAALILAAAACTPTGSGGTGQGAELVKSKCTMCHTIDRVTQANKDRSSWDQTVARMRAKGAVMTDAEAAQIAEYLSQSGAVK